MTEIRQCSQCGGEIPPGTRRGICPRCLLGLGVQSPLESIPVEVGSFAEGRRFADYELLESLGEGGMGVVYKAVQISLRRPVALKMIRDANAHSPEARQRFAIEAEAAAKLDHPNIVPIYSVGEHDEQPFLSMKFVAGENLRVKIARGELCIGGPTADPSAAGLRSREAAVASLVAIVARAIQHAHENGVLHRDLKPGNIIVDGDGLPHLTDFGLAKILDQAKSEGLTRSDNVLGTPAYMSPEQASGQRVTAASDIYSLGAVFYELLTGQPVFKGGTPLETMRMVMEKDARRPSAFHHRIDRDLETICLKCLEKNPASRYPSAGALAEDLDRWSRHEPIQARSAGPVLRLTRWVRRNPVGAALIVSLFFGLAAVSMLLKLSWDATSKSRGQVRDINDELTKEVEEMWEDPTQTFVPIPASSLTTLANLPPARRGSNPLRLILAKRIGEDPIGEATAYAPVLRLIQERMEKRLGRGVVFDLRFYKLTGGDALRPVADGEVDIQRTGPVAYLRAELAGLKLVPVAQEKAVKAAVIFAGKGTGITNLNQVAGRRVAFGHTNSVLSCIAKYHLATNGITADRLKHFEHFERMDSQPAQGGTVHSELHAHREVLQRVLNGEFDVGESQRRHFESTRHRGNGLVELFSFRVPPDVYVAKAGLGPDVIAALRHALVSLKGRRDLELLGSIESPPVTGFTAITNGYFDDLRSALTNFVMQFDSPSMITRDAQNLDRPSKD